MFCFHDCEKKKVFGQWQKFPSVLCNVTLVDNDRSIISCWSSTGFYTVLVHFFKQIFTGTRTFWICSCYSRFSIGFTLVRALQSLKMLFNLVPPLLPGCIGFIVMVEDPDTFYLQCCQWWKEFLTQNLNMASSILYIILLIFAKNLLQSWCLHPHALHWVVGMEIRIFLLTWWVIFIQKNIISKILP